MFAILIRLIHILFVIFIIITPFIQNLKWIYLVLHVVVIGSLVLHWATNEDVCFLTWLECYVKGVPKSESFIHSLVSPIYKIADSDLKNIIHTVTPLLGSISFYRLFSNWVTVKSDVLNLLHLQEKVIHNI